MCLLPRATLHSDSEHVMFFRKNKRHHPDDNIIIQPDNVSNVISHSAT
jgi:hypothetical protein